MSIDWKNIIAVAVVVIGFISVFVIDAFADARYIPADEIEWWLESTNHDEIIQSDKIDKTSYRFQIIPDKTKLTQEEIVNYPIELFWRKDVSTLSEIEVYEKTPLKINRDYSITPIAKDPKTPIISVSDSINLNDYYGVDLYINPDINFSDLYLKYGVHSATYNAVSNAIIVTGSPVTYQEIHDDIGDESIFAQLGLNQFLSTASIYYGDDTTPTHVIDDNIQLTISGSCNCNYHHYIQDNAVLTLTNSSFISEEDVVENRILTIDGEARISNCILIDEHISDPGRINGGNLPSYIHDAIINGIWFGSPNFELENIEIFNSSIGIYLPGSSCTMSNIEVYDSSAGSALGFDASTSVFNDCYLHDNILTDIALILTTGTASYVNCVLDDWTPVCVAPPCDSGINRQYTLDLTVLSGSTTIENASVIIRDLIGNVVYSGLTPASGTIPQQTLFYGTYAPDTGTPVMYTPHEIEITAYGYLPYIADIFMDEEKDLEIALQVESGTNAGDVMIWLDSNMATLSWWEENMGSLILILLFLAMVAMGIWSCKRKIGWLGVVCGIGVLTIATSISGDNLAYGAPFIVIGIGMFLIGATNIKNLE